MFLYGTGAFDARVTRSAMSLAKAGYRVTLIGLRSHDEPDQEETGWGTVIRVGGRDTRRTVDELNPLQRGARRFFRLRQVLWLARYVQTYSSWRARAVRAGIAASRDASQVVWHGHDLTGLAPAAAAQAERGGSLVYDSHELYLESGSLPSLPRPIWRLLFAYERRLARGADRVITVNETIAQVLSKRYRIRKPVVVMNCPPLGLEPVAPDVSPLRDLLGRPTGRRILVIHGLYAAGRGLLESVEALRHLPDECVLVLLGSGPWESRLRDISEDPTLGGRLVLHPPVPQVSLLSWLSGADVSLCALTADNLSHYYAAPNRLFEALGAGVPVVVSDFPELRPIVDRYGVGAVCDSTDPSSIAAAALQLLDEPESERNARRARCRLAVEETYNWERQAQVLLRVYEDLSHS
jgi:glycosyltransferase involved in cell wall biosynthesis